MEEKFFENIFSSKNERKRTLQENSQPRVEEAVVWVFGYGSLVYFPGFKYEKCLTGYIKNYSRRFYQGNNFHRGTKNKIGRVATLVENKNNGTTWGCAYKIIGETALQYLDERECTLGGYKTEFTKFFPRIATAENSEISGEPIEVLLYIATNSNANKQWLGEAPLIQIANDIVEAEGINGTNVEYLIRLSIFMREELPNIIDDHLFELERLVKEILIEKQISLSSMMGSKKFEKIVRDTHEENRIKKSFEFTSRVPEKKLRCLNI